METTNLKQLVLSLLMLRCIYFLDVVSGYEPGEPDITLEYNICNGETGEYLHGIDVDHVVNNLVSNTPNMGYDCYNTYGHAACGGRLIKEDCTTCLNAAIENFCNPYRTGNQVQLYDCRIRFENYPFVE